MILIEINGDYFIQQSNKSLFKDWNGESLNLGTDKEFAQGLLNARLEIERILIF
jgi:hypothetical protein